MQLNGERTIAASRQALWVALNDPEVLSRCLPGCEGIDRVSDVEFAVTATAAAGRASEACRGTIRLSDVDPPSGYRFEGELGSAGAGFAAARGRVELIAAGEATLLRYELQADMGDELAQQAVVGTTDAALAPLVEAFFVRFEEAVAETHAARVRGAAGAGAGAAAHPLVQPLRDEPRAGLRPGIWVPALMLIVALILYTVS
ncbi:MAG TPA: SRPBCC domain-containing protein [Rhodospirillales bacterium]|nr:SRPBCC domain-containing protein [Rhodospirillales bacterium]